MIYFVITLLVIGLIYLIWNNDKKCQLCAMENFTSLNNKTVVIFKTHVWNNNIEIFVKKLYADTSSHYIDFYILIHSNDGSLLNKIPTEFNNLIIPFSEYDIRSTYTSGFYGMWLSNHWILMWFFNKVNRRYDYYWSIEYDVRISGDTSLIWSWNGDQDFIYPIKPFQDPTWTWKNHYVGGILNDDTKWYGYLQLARYSKRFLEWLDYFYSNGENGQDEMITFSLFKRGENYINLTGNHNLLNNLIRDSWTVFNQDSDKHKKILCQSEKNNEIVIAHPVKY